MKTAIIYYSMCGNTKFAAEEISKRLGADLIEITPEKEYPSKGIRKFLWGGKSAMMSEKPALNPYTFNAGGYDRIIFGFPVWASRIAPPIRTFIEENKAALQTKQISAFCCQSGAGGGKALEGLKNLLEIENFNATAILTDPKDKPSEKTKELISVFCEKN